MGFEQDRIVYSNLMNRFNSCTPDPSMGELRFVNESVENVSIWDMVDVTFCFSLLPYVDRPTDLLLNMRKFSEVSFIECQYSGDGPGFEWIKNDIDMLRWLERVGWKSVSKLGRTRVSYRNVDRTIWMCEK